MSGEAQMQKWHALVLQDWTALSAAPPEVCSSRGIVLAAVSRANRALEYAAGALLTNTSFMLEAIERNPWAFRYASEAVLRDGKFWQWLLSSFEPALSYLVQEGCTACSMKSIILENKALLSLSMSGVMSGLLETSGKHHVNDFEQHPDLPEPVRSLINLKYNTRQVKAELKLFRRHFASVLRAVDAIDQSLLLAAIGRSWGRVLLVKGKDFVAEYDFWQAAVQRSGMALAYASQEMRQDCDLIKVAMQRNILVLFHTSWNSCVDVEFMIYITIFTLVALASARFLFSCAASCMAANRVSGELRLAVHTVACVRIAMNVLARLHLQLSFLLSQCLPFQWLPGFFRLESSVALMALERNHRVFKYIPRLLLSRQDFCQQAVEHDGLMLKHVCHELRLRPDIALAAIHQNIKSVQFVPRELLEDVDFSLQMLRADASIYVYLPFKFRRNSRLAVESVSARSDLINHVPRVLRADREFWLALVHRDWSALQLADAKFRADTGIVLEAVQQCWKAVQFAQSMQLVVMIEAVKQDWHAIELVFDSVRYDAERIILAESNPRIIQFHSLKHERAVVLAAVRRNGLALQYATDVLKKDYEIVSAAVKQNAAALNHAHASLHQDPALRTLTTVDRQSESCNPAYSDESNAMSSHTEDHDCDLLAIFSNISNSQPLARAAKAICNAISAHDLERAKRSSSTLSGPDEITNLINNKLAHKYSRCFSQQPSQYGERGGHPYFKPTGWVRFAVCNKQGFPCDWPVAYHGTALARAIRILCEGLLRPSSHGDVAHGQAHSRSGCSIYLSPSAEYAAHPVYAALAEVGPSDWIQVVVQVRVRPGSYSRHRGSLGGRHWPQDVRMDPNYKTLDDLEWLVESPDDAFIVGLLMREFGTSADRDLYGDSATRVTRGQHGPEYEWSRLRAEEFREKGLFLEQ